MDDNIKILLVDDERDMLVLLERILSSKEGYKVTATHDPRKAAELIEKNDFDIVITDLKMPYLDGMKILELAKQKNHDTVVIILTAYGTIDSAVEATKKGAFDYITKPFRKDRILHVIDQGLKWYRMCKENTYLREELLSHAVGFTLVGASEPIVKLREQIARVANTSATVLITGESGTGKELVARAIHNQSSRRGKPFVPINCSALPEQIVESELFGHIKGAFTGAIKEKKGVVEEAKGGTLFLDEIGDLALSIQVKFLRLLQEGEYRPVGSNTIKKADVRYIAATNQDLPQKIERNEFREDLYYRLNVVHIHVPSLRDRKDDIIILVNHFLKKYGILHNKAISGITEEAMQFLKDHEWRGNVRELENTIERGVIMATGDKIKLEDLSPEASTQRVNTVKGVLDNLYNLPFKEAKEKIIDEFQTHYLAKLLSRNSGNITRTAEESGLKRQYIYKLLKKTNIDPKSLK